MVTDEGLALALQGGDTSALDALVERHYDLLIGYLYRLLHGERSLAQDIAQETFLRALRGISRYTHPRPFKPWLYAIATNLARDHYNRADTRRVAPMPEDEHPALTSDAAADDDLTIIEEARTVIAGLAALPDHQREVIILYFYQDMPLDAIADSLNIPLGTVKSRLSIGISRLRERIKQDERA